MGRRQHVGLINRGQSPRTGFRARERVLGDALDFASCVYGLIDGAFSARFGLDVMLAEINISRQLAHEIDVHVIGSIRSQRRKALQRRPQINWTKINVQAKFFAQRQQAALGAIAERLRVPFGAANSSQQDGVR